MNRRDFIKNAAKTSFIFAGGLWIPKLGILRPTDAESSFFQHAAGASAKEMVWNRSAQVVSVRRVVNGYTGPCMLVRRSSDDAELDIGFVNGWLDETALSAHVGTGDGFVKTWYDQSGNGRHVTQTTAGNQPRIVISGIVCKSERPRPVVRFDGTDNFMTMPSVGTGLYRYISMAVMFRNTGAVGIIVENSSTFLENAGSWIIEREQGGYSLTIGQQKSTGVANIQVVYQDPANQMSDMSIVSVVLDRNFPDYSDQSAAYSNTAEVTLLPYSTYTKSCQNIQFADLPSYLGARNGGSVGQSQLDISEIGIYVTDQISHYQNRERDMQAVFLLEDVSEPDWIVLGDSTIAAYLGNAVASYVRTSTGKCPVSVSDISYPGHTILQQNAAWSALDSSIKTASAFVVVQVGLNDLNPAESAVDAITRYQDLIDDIISDAAQAAVYTCTMTPCKQRLIDVYGAVDGLVAYTKFLALNESFSGLGANPIIGMDGVVTAHTTLLNDGSGNLSAIYDTGDHIHENNAGRQIVADAWSDKLISDSLL